jgi:hypothetical protein
MNFLTRLRRKRCRPEELLILIPSCLQQSQCGQRITNDIAECRRCGKCKVKDVIELSEKHGTRCAIATGGRLALQMARDSGVKAIVAVACEKELTEGMRAVFPKAALGIVNLRPNGPCRDTDVHLEELEEAVKEFLGLSSGRRMK